MTERIQARDQCFALVNRRANVIEAVSTWCFMLHEILNTLDDKDCYEVVHLADNLRLGELGVIASERKERNDG